MPVLPNPRHEAFAQALVRGRPATEACSLKSTNDVIFCEVAHSRGSVAGAIGLLVGSVPEFHACVDAQNAFSERPASTRLTRIG
jgi:hypothetical protein